ncbi:MAG: CNNM domain-containing protein [Planctomycetota bacterium]
MLLLAIVLLIAGIFLSGFFSGSETGFYRASRVRIVIAGLDGDRISKSLIWLINNPALFVATTLIGNNVANYLTSLAIVLLAKEASVSSAVEMLAPILMSPLLFVYGELLPKNLFYQAPNLLLRLAAPLFLLFTALFAPAAAVLWGMSRVLEVILGKSPEQVRLLLARKEIQQALEAGFEAGILHPTQRHLAQSFFLVAAKPVGEICWPLMRTPSIPKGTPVEDAKVFAQRFQIADIPIYDEKRTNIIGYVRTIDLLINQETIALEDVLRPLRSIEMTELYGETILQMQTNRETLVKVVSKNGEAVGLLSMDQLTDPLLDGPLGSLKR